MAEDDGATAEGIGMGRQANHGDSDDAGGTYTLVLELADAATIDVGALGPVGFRGGWYAYTGSALGPGGFSRVARHRELAAGERETRHWHVDYLLGHDAATVEAVVRTAGVDAECPVSDAIAGDRVPGFGASDCDCGSHLVYSSDREGLLWSVERAHENAG